MSLLKNVKDIIFFEKDEDFFDKEATIKEYYNVCPPEKRKAVKSYNELYEEALKYVNKQNFEENTQMVDNYFEELCKEDIVIAILIGAFAYKIACYVDEHGKEWEKKLDEILPDGFDKNNPFDTKVGGNHRDFGHDIFTFGLRNIPNDFKIIVGKNGHRNIYKPIGEVLNKNGNISMLDLIWHYYGKDKINPFYGFFTCMGHTIVHFAKDLLTSEGLPLPFSSLLYQYKLYNTENRKMIGYKVTKSSISSTYKPRSRNSFNRKVDNYKGNIKASDFASLSTIEVMCKIYSHQKQLEDKEQSYNRNLKIIAMGTCIMIQMSSLLLGKYEAKKNNIRGKMAMIPGAKLNVVMTSVMFKNMVQEMGVVINARKDVNVGYDRKIKQLRKENSKNE